MSSAAETHAAAGPSSRKLAGYTAWNLVGMCAPMLVAVFAIPLLIRGLGADRFGTLSLIWMLVGYFSVLDLGLGRAMTKLTAEYIGRGRDSELPGIFWTALGVMALLGLAGGAALAGLSGWLVDVRLRIPPELRAETRLAFLAVSIGMPVAVATTGLIGVLEAHHRFRLINLIRVPMGAFTFAGPLMVLPFSKSLYAVVMVLIAGRLVEWVAYFACCLVTLPALRRRLAWDERLLGPLLRFGGWMTVSNIALPLMIHVDRLLIGALLPIAMVTYYATPAEIVVKLLIFPRAWVSVLFPSMTAAFAAKSSTVGELYSRGVRYLVLAAFPVALAVMLGAHEGLQIWLGADLADKSARVMQWLTAGIFVYSLAYMPFSLLQSAGRPDLSARLHALELPLYLVLSSAMIRRFGIEGASAAWLLRSVVEAAILFWMVRRFTPGAGPSVGRAMALAAAGLLLAGGGACLDSFAARLAVGGLLLPAFLAIGWRWLLSEQERTLVREQARRLASRA